MKTFLPPSTVLTAALAAALVSAQPMSRLHVGVVSPFFR